MTASLSPAASARRVDALRGWMEQLADPTRLRLLRALERQELVGRSSCARSSRLPQSTVCRHLKVLADAGWLASRRDGNQSLYGWAEGIDAGARRLWRARPRRDARAGALERQDAARLVAVTARRDGAAAVLRRRRRRLGPAARRGLRERRSAPRRSSRSSPATWTVADLGCGTGAVSARARAARPPRRRGRSSGDDAPRRAPAGRGAPERRAPRGATSRRCRSTDALRATPPSRCSSSLYLDGSRAALREATRDAAPGRPARRGRVDPPRTTTALPPPDGPGASPASTPRELVGLSLRDGLATRPRGPLPPEPGARGPGSSWRPRAPRPLTRVPTRASPEEKPPMAVSTATEEEGHAPQHRPQQKTPSPARLEFTP